MKSLIVYLYLFCSISIHAQDVWKLVPPVPTGCYSSQDSFLESINIILKQVDTETYRQEEINNVLLDSISSQEYQALTLKYLSEHSITPTKFTEDMTSSISFGKKALDINKK
ncbi:MAG: hypothetical protein ABJC12_00705 [Saprospiraceae bacterium]